MNIDLDSLSLDELRELRGNVDRAMAGFKDRKRRDAIAAAEEAARQHGFSSLSELTRGRRASAPSTSRGARGKAWAAAAASGGEARYRNPQDESQTWSGRGRRPRWFQDALAAGKNPADLSA